jgi:hypothetical protein
MKTENITQSKPPYVAYKTFTNFISSLRESGIPDRIDRSVIPGLSGVAQSFLLAALRYLGLINNDGSPAPTLKDLVDNTATEKATLAKIIKEKYGFIFGGSFNIASATDAQLTEIFKEQGLNGSTIVKALSFFTSLCESAGIQISPHLKSKRSSIGGNGTARRPYRKRKSADEVPPIVPAQHASHAKTFQELLLEKFPTFNPDWEAETAKKWFDNFEKLMGTANKTEQKQ